MVFTTIDTSLTPVAATGAFNVPNILINGGMAIWQRGGSFTTPAHGVLTADRWKVSRDGTTSAFTITREATIIDSGLYALKLDVTTVGDGTGVSVEQEIENYEEYKGKTITVSMRLRTNVAGKLLFRLHDGVTFTSSNIHTGDSTYQTLTATKTVSASASRLRILIGFQGGGLAISASYFDSVMMVNGTEAVPFVSKSIAIELAQCQRYFYRIAGNITSEQIGAGACFSTTVAAVTVRHPVDMATSPTCTVNGATDFRVFSNVGSGIAATAVVVTLPSVEALRLDFTVASGLVIGDATLAYSNAITGYVDVSADI